MQNYKYYNPEVREQLSEIIRAEFEQVGYQYEEENPELYFDFTLLVEDMVDTVNQTTGNPNYRWREFEQDRFNYKKGALIINLVNIKSGDVIWQSRAEKQLDRQPKDGYKRSQRIIKEMFVTFPTKTSPTN